MVVVASKASWLGSDTGTLGTEMLKVGKWLFAW